MGGTMTGAWRVWRRGAAVAGVAVFSVFMAGLYVGLVFGAISLAGELLGLTDDGDDGWIMAALIITSVLWVPYGIGRVARVELTE